MTQKTYTITVFDCNKQDETYFLCKDNKYCRLKCEWGYSLSEMIYGSDYGKDCVDDHYLTIFEVCRDSDNVVFRLGQDVTTIDYEGNTINGFIVCFEDWDRIHADDDFDHENLTMMVRLNNENWYSIHNLKHDKK